MTPWRTLGTRRCRGCGAARLRGFDGRTSTSTVARSPSPKIAYPAPPAVLSRYWRDTPRACGHEAFEAAWARHTAATLMHLDGVPVAVIAGWIGHKDASLTMKLYAHSQDDALKLAATAIDYLQH